LSRPLGRLPEPRPLKKKKKSGKKERRGPRPPRPLLFCLMRPQCTSPLSSHSPYKIPGASPFHHFHEKGRKEKKGKRGRGKKSQRGPAQVPVMNRKALDEAIKRKGGRGGGEEEMYEVPPMFPCKNHPFLPLLGGKKKEKKETKKDPQKSAFFFPVTIF